MRLSTLLPLLGLFAFGYAKKCPRQRTSPGKEILCYTSSNNAEELIEAICKCTTLVHQGYQLHNISTAGVEELQKALKEANPALQVVVSVTDPQGTLRTSATTRQEASGRLADALSQVDGVQLDMTAGSKERLSHFIKGLKDEMIRKSNEKRIILALPTKPEELAKQYDLKTLAKYADLFTLSTHYLVDDTESFKTFHPSRLMGIFDMLNTDSLVDLVSGLGVPKKKLLVSVPASAYKFTLKTDDKNVPGSPVKEEEPTAISRKELCDMMNAGEWTVERDTDLTAPYAFKDSTWIAYEDKTSIGIKGKYVLLRELAGLGVHDIENDVKNDCGKAVTHEVYHSFTDMKRKTRGAVLASLQNDLQHEQIPQSKHVRSSGFRIVRIVDTAGAIHAIRENTQTEFMCTRQGYFVHPKSCNRFYRCVKFNQGIDDYSVFEFDCPAGLAFDERTEVCVWPGSLTEGSPCPGSSEIAPVPRARFQCPQRNGYYADPQNCRWFFACFDLGEPELTAYEFRCPFGLVFDEQKLICEWPWLVPGCGVSGYSRTEYGSGYVQGHGTGSGQGSGSGGIGIGDYSGSGIGAGISGHYPLGLDSSSYGSRASESRQSETGAGAGGIKFAQHGSGGAHYNNLGQGVSGSGNFGAGSGATTYSGASGIGNYESKGSGLGYNQANIGHSGSSTINGGNSGSAGAGVYGQGEFLVETPEANDFYSIHRLGILTGNSGAGSTVSGGEHGFSSYPGVGVTSTLHSGSGSAGVKYSNEGAGSGSGSAGNFGSYEFGARYPTSTGSGSAQSQYSGKTGSTSAYNGLGNAGVVIETQGHDSHIYSSGTTGSGHGSGAGYTGSGSLVNTAGNNGYNGFASTATNYGGSGKEGLTVSLQTGGSHGDFSTGFTGSDHTANSGHYLGTQASGNEYISGATRGDYSEQGNSGYVTSGERVSDSQDVINGASISGSGVLTGTTGNVYRGTKGGYTQSIGDHSSGLGTGYVVYGGGNEGTAAPGISIQTVTPGYTGSSIGTGIVHGGSGTGVEYTNSGAFVTGSVYGTGNTGSGNVVIDHGSDYNSGYTSGSSSGGSGLTLVNTGAGNEGGSGYVETGSSSTVSDIGKGGISTGTTTYHGNGGSSSSYLASKTNSNTNTNTYDDSSSTLSHGDTSGVVISGDADEVSVYGGTVRPGYVQTNSVTPGHTSHGITHSTYTNTAPGTFLTGTAVPNVVVTGTAAPGVIVHTSSGSGSGSYSGEQSHGGGSAGHTVGVSGTTTYYGNTGSSAYATSTGNTGGFTQGESDGGNAGFTGSNFGSKTTYVGTGASTSDQDMGYKTNEYELKEHRGTVTFNNGYSTSKYTESDVRDRQPAYASLPDTIVSGGRIENSNGVVLGNTLAGINAYTSHGFTKTGPTKTGYTTAAIGGSGSYVTNTGYSGPTSTPVSNIYAGQNSGEGYSGGTSIEHEVNNLAYVTSTVSPDVNHIDTSKINLGHGSSDTSSGYEYKQPTVPFVTGTVTAPTPTPLSVTYHQPIVPLTITTPSSHLNVEAVYNTPSVVTSAPITLTPAVVNTYSYRRPTGGSNDGTVSSGYKYKRPTQTVVYQDQQTTVYRRPIDTQKQYIGSPTPTPIAYATGPAEVYKTTLFEAAKQPIAVSTVAPVYDTGYKTVISSTATPIAVTTGEYFYSDSRFNTGPVPTTGQTPGHLDITYQQPEITFQKGYVSSTSAPNTEEGYTYEKPSTRLTYNSHSTVTPSVTVYQRPEVTFQKQYVSSTPAPNTEEGYTYEKPSKQLTYHSPSTVTPPVTIYQRPEVTFQKYYVNSTPAPNTGVGYTYEKPRKQLTYNSPSTVTPSVEIYQRPEVTLHEQFVSSTIAPNTDEGYTYEKPRKQLTYNSPSTVTPSVTIYERPASTVQEQVKYGSQSTIAPDFDSVYNRPSASIRPAFNKPSTFQKGYSVVSTVAPVSDSQGYDYSKPAIKFVSSTSAPAYRGSQGYGGSPTKPDIPQKEITKLVGNYDRGSMRYTPPKIYVDEYSGNTDSGDNVFGSKTYGNSVTSKTYEATTPNSVIRTNTYGDYTSNTGGSTSGSEIGSTGYKTGGYYSSTGGSTSGSGIGSTGYKTGGYYPTTGGSTSGSETGTTGYKTGGYYSSTGGSTSGSGIGSTGYKTGGYYPTTGGSTSGSEIGTTGYKTGGYYSSTGGATSGSGIGSTGYKTGGYYSTSGGSTSGSGIGSSGYKTGGYGSTPLYEVSTVKSAVGRGKGKVIVKLSDLHPLLLGKLGAQCTCRSDPFETLRGPGSKIVKSSRGDVDLAQYDESEIYVDLETDREPSQSNAVYRTPNGSPTSAPAVYSSSFRTPVTAVFGLSTPATTIYASRGKPSTAYLPVASSPSPIVKSRGSSSFKKTIPLENEAYEASSDNLDSQFASLPAGFISGDVPVGRSAGVGRKAGKSLVSSGAAGNAIGGAGAAFDRYGPGGLRGVDETLQGGTDCARPGLFRHPKFCNKFYACHWDEWKQKFTLHVFNCPVHLSYDSNAGACNWPSKGPACQDDNLLV